MGLFSKLKKVHKAIKPGGKASPVGLVRNAGKAKRPSAPSAASVQTKPLAAPTRAGGSQPLSRSAGGGNVRGTPTPTGWKEGPAKPSAGKRGLDNLRKPLNSRTMRK